MKRALMLSAAATLFLLRLCVPTLLRGAWDPLGDMNVNAYVFRAST